jgi:histidinol-phosphate/aromatic aminotransferase/cobyric acid decarboxylase-like protein
MKPMTRHDLMWTLGIAAATTAFLLLISRPQLGKVSEVRQSLREERERLWARFREFGDDPDDYADRRPGPTEVVVLEPRSS